MECERLEALIAGAESRLLELKRDWFDFGSDSDKGTFVKEVLALSNAALPDEKAYMIVGVTDESEGKEIVGVHRQIDQDRAQNILDSYTSPTPRVSVSSTELDGKRLGLVKVEGVEYGPCFATKDVEGELSTFYTYTRRQGVASPMTPQELKEVVRGKLTGRGVPVSQRPIRAGFVKATAVNIEDGIGVRVVNVTDAPVEGVYLLVKAESAKPRGVARRKIFESSTMYGGRSFESTFRYRKLDFVNPQGTGLVEGRVNTSRGVDLDLHVHFRDQSGFYEKYVRSLTVGD